MNDDRRAIAAACLKGAESDSIAFPEICARLIGAGFERYAVDFARSACIYYLPDGDSIALDTHAAGTIGEAFDGDAIRAAIREAQTQAPGYSYAGFCAKIAAAGCTGYFVSFPGRRVVYSGRTGETHVEHFPQ